MNLETIQGMWEKDSQIDPDELHTSSLVVPTLHAKYYQLYNDLRLLRTKCKKIYQKVLQERYLYYSGKAEPEVYEKEPFPYKVREKFNNTSHLDHPVVILTWARSHQLIQCLQKGPEFRTWSF